MPEEERYRTISEGNPRLAGVRYVFLDRDGVINRKLPDGRYVTRWEEFEMLPGVAETIAAWNRSGRKVIVVSNQRGVALGLMTKAEVEAIHDRLRAELGRDGARLDAIYYCPHNRDECECRKPRTGMIEAAFRDFPSAEPKNSVLIGDARSDIECGSVAGMATIFIARDGDEDGAVAARELGATAVVSSLTEASLLLD